MKKPLIVANWKCNPTTLAGAKFLFSSIKKGSANLKDIETVICPPFPYLLAFDSNRKSKIKLGAQNVFWQEKGAFTGQVSPLMLKDLGVKYVIIGHSERRALGETDSLVNKKLKLALKVGLKPILCIANLSQLKKSLKGILGEIIIAYEPLFAIGTGKPCSLGQARKIRKKIKYPLVLYGGSVNSQNAKGYIKEAGFQGLLVGSASLDDKEFVKIIKSAK